MSPFGKNPVFDMNPHELMERVIFLETGISLGLSREALLRGSEYEATAHPVPAGTHTSPPLSTAGPAAQMPGSPGDFALPGQAHHSSAAPAPQSGSPTLPSAESITPWDRQQAKSNLLPLTPRATRLHGMASAVAKELGDSYVGCEHILIALIRMDHGVAGYVMNHGGVTERAVLDLRRPPH